MNLFNFDKDNDYKETWEYKGSKEFYDRLMIYNRYFFDHKARSLFEEVYLLTRKYPEDELYNLMVQVCRGIEFMPLKMNDGLRRHFLEVAYVSVLVVSEVYELTLSFPIDDKYALTDQLRKAVVLVTSIIVEVVIRSSEEKLHSYHIAYDHLSEIRSLLTLACELDIISNEKLGDICQHIETVARVMNDYRKSL